MPCMKYSIITLPLVALLTAFGTSSVISVVKKTLRCRFNQLHLESVTYIDSSLVTSSKLNKFSKLFQFA